LSLGSCRDVAEGEAVTKIEVSTAQLSLLVGRDSAITARAILASGAFLDGARIFWSAEQPDVATVDATGRVAGITPGAARIAASAGGRSAVVQVSVAPVPVATVLVTPASAGAVVGDTLPFSAAALLISGDTAVGRRVTWRSSRPTVAAVDSTGRVLAITAGSASITATVDGISGTAAVSITRAPVALVVVSPPSATVLVGAGLEMRATTFAADSTQLQGRTITWTTSAPTTATVSSKGVVTALAPGVTTITATSEGQRGTARVTVVRVPVHSVAVLPTTSTILLGATTRLVAAALDSIGGVLGGRSIVWRSLTPALATVDSTGLVTAVGVGVARIAATSEGKTGTATITISNPPVARVTVNPRTVSLAPGSTAQFTVAMFDAAGTLLPGRKVTWLSGSSTIARVDQQGLATAIAKGTVLIFATSEGVTGSATLTVK
jgi:uncharacterized protein YjdB